MTEYTGQTIDITPEWEATTEYFATVLAEHGFVRCAYDVSASLLEMARHLAINDPEALDRVITRLNHRGEMSRARVTVRARA